MRRLSPGCVISVAGRRMTVIRVETWDGIRIIIWRRVAELEAVA